MENQPPIQNQNQYQYQYQNHVQYPDYTTNKNQEIVSVSDWIIAIILTSIPFVNIIMLLVWAFGSNTPKSKANWAKAGLIVQLVIIIIVACFYGSIIAIILSAAALGQ